MEFWGRTIPVSLGFLTLLQIHLVQSAGWSYSGPTGPANWASIAATCGGSKQSPINIVTSATTVNSSLGEITLKNFGNPVGPNATLTNNGHTVKVDLTGSSYSISGGGLSGTFNLDQFHFHWGTSDSTGSEHTLDGKQYPMEVHFVSHSNSYGTLNEAVGNADGLAVLGFFFEVGSSTNTAMEPLTDLLMNVTNSGDTVSIPTSITLSSFIPTNRDMFYRYQGSLTTPGCNEVVTWTVFKEAIKISAAQMNKFRGVQDTNGTSISGNFRPVQPLQGRAVYASRNSGETLSSFGIVCAISLAIVSKVILF